MERFLKIIKIVLKVFLGIVAIYLLIVIGFNIPKLIKDKKVDADSQPNGLVFDVDEYENKLKATPSDIEGWSQYDKKKAGLVLKDGADTDGDGLTDKEEIEIYGSDPKKASTVGDLYTDGYKVANGMNLKEKYEYEGTPVFENNKSEEVILTASAAEDLTAWVIPVINDEVSGYTVYKTYDVYNYQGKLSIDAGTVASDNGVDVDDLVVLMCGWGDENLKKQKVSVNNSVITLDSVLERKNRYNVIVAKADGENASDSPKSSFSFNGREDPTVAGQEFVYVHFLPIFNMFDYGRKPHMYFVPTGDKTMDYLIISYLREFAIDSNEGMLVDITEDDIKPVSAIKMKAIKALLEPFTFFRVTSLIGDIDTNDSEEAIKYLFCIYNDSEALPPEQYNSYLGKETKIQYAVSSDTGFSTTGDEFAFPNFCSEYATGGNCAGIAYYTAYMFNKSEGIPKGEYKSSRYSDGSETLSWDITTDSENATLLDRGLASYKDMYFTGNHYKNGRKILTDLTPGEEEFVKMIGALWAKSNDVMDPVERVEDINPEYGAYSWDMIEEMMSYLDNKQILVLAMMDCDGYGHAINVVDYKKIVKSGPDGEEIRVIFNLYDNIFPRNHKSKTGPAEIVNPVLIVDKKHCNSGYTESFSYSYKPKDMNYEYSSTNNSYDLMEFVVMDSDFNVLNDNY